MRGHDSRRPAPTARHFRLCLPVSSCASLLLLVFIAFGDVRARNVPLNQQGQGVPLDEAQVSEVREEVLEESHQSEDAVKEEPKIGSGSDLPEETFSVAKKRRRNDVLAPFAKHEEAKVEKDRQGVADEGIRRFDAQLDTEEQASEGQKGVVKDPSQSPVKNVEVGTEDAEGHAKRLLDVVKPAFEAAMESIIRDKVVETSEAQGSSAQRIPEVIPVIAIDDPGRIIQEIIGNVNAAAINTDIRNDLRSLEQRVPEDTREVVERNLRNEETLVVKPLMFRENRQLSDSPGKPKYKTSTIYLNADEDNTRTRDQESIVNDQIKKLISIRDDALGSIIENAANVSSPAGIRRVDENISGEGEIAKVERSPSVVRSESLQDSPASRIQRWKEEAFYLQEQIKDRAVLQHLKEQANVVLPNAPKFNERQLLDALRTILSSRTTSLNESYASTLNASLLTSEQLEIIKCTEHLVDPKQRRSFIENMSNCIRGLSVLNCMRIFVWPILADNIPNTIAQNLPIEVNLIDLFQGSRGKSGRSADSGGHRQPILTPYSMVSNILSDILKNLPQAEAAPTFFDARNETLKKFLSSNQLEILQMAEKVLPGGVRREYADRMFSCVRRFEYFSCVRYFTWPLVKQYYPSLPSFPLPDYDSLYPPIPVISGYPQYPQYPIPPFPGFSEGTAELPEVVDVDGTRMKEDPRPEAMIIHILKDTLKEHSKLPEAPTALDPKDTVVAVIPQEQLMAVYMAEQLLPAPYRPEFVQKTVRCIHEYNYLSCIKYSMWPTIRQLVPGVPQLPDISGLFPDFQIPELPDFFGFLPQLPNLPDFSGFFPASTTDTKESPLQITEPESVAVLVTRSNHSSRDANSTEARITEILTKVRDSLTKRSDVPSLIIGGNVVILTTITEDQVNILRLAESILPPQNRAALITQVLSCLEEKNEFVNCTRCIIWPSINVYAPNLPEFPGLGANQKSSGSVNAQDCLRHLKNQSNLDGTSQEQLLAEASRDPSVQITSRNSISRDPSSRNQFQESNIPVISVTGTRFVPILSEHPETVVLSILRTVELSVPNAANRQNLPDYSQILNDVQREIVRIVENLLPDSIRTDIVTSVFECVRQNDFLTCTREIIWPAMLQYFPSLPTFPNFGPTSTPASNVTSTSPTLNLTETSSSTDSVALSETNVKTGQHGDAMVTIMDTRFVPIFSEHPEGVIMNILRAVQLSIPNLQSETTSMKNHELGSLLTEQQLNILQLTETLLPESTRTSFLSRMTTCVRGSVFLDCMRDIAWPTIGQYFPRLPSFPNFGSLQNLPRTKLPQPSLNASSQDGARNRSDLLILEQAESKIELILQQALSKDSKTLLEHSYLNTEDPAVSTLLTDKQANILKLTEIGIPDPDRSSYMKRVLDCARSHSFISCTQNISWPVLKQHIPGLPDFPSLNLPELPDLGQIALPSLPQLPGTFAEIPGLPQLPGLPQIPGISEIPGVSQLPGVSQDLSKGVQVTRNEGSKIIGTDDLPAQEKSVGAGEKSAITPSVADQTIVLGYAGQPSEIVIDLSKEKVTLPELEEKKSIGEERKSRKRRDTMDLLAPSLKFQEDRKSSRNRYPKFPNVTESEFLKLLVDISKSREFSVAKSTNATKKEYFVDTLNSTIRNSLTADQYEILKLAEDLAPAETSRGLLQQTFQCITSLSFIRCVGIFVWPMIANNLPSILPSLPFGRSVQSQPNNLFGMSPAEVEAELLARKASIEKLLVNWYSALASNEFQKDFGFLRIKGYGNGELGIGLASSREGRAKIKDNKNLPSILTIISDIMEEVLDQRPDPEKSKRDRDKKERSLRNFQESGYQTLSSHPEEETEERSINDDKIIGMFLEKIRANASAYSEEDAKQYLNLDDAYNAFEVLFGTRLNGKFAERLRTFTGTNRPETSLENEPVHEISIVPLESRSEDPAKILPLDGRVSYDLEKETANEQKERNRHRTKTAIVKLIDEYSDKYLQDTRVEDVDQEKQRTDSKKYQKKEKNSELTVQLPRLNEEILSRKTTDALSHIGKSMKKKMGQMMPGIGMAMSFLLQVALAHARAAASVAGILSNMAMGTAMVSMIRDMMFGGNENPKIKYVYDNDSTKPGVTWPQGPYATAPWQ